MNRQWGVLIGVICAVLLAAWLYVAIPSAGVIVFVGATVFALIYTMVALLRGKEGTRASKIKNAWKAVLDFFWGM